MNDILYRDLIVGWIPYIQRPILQVSDIWLLSYKKGMCNRLWCCILVDIILHAGVPCDTRYCICHYFTIDDKVEYYKLNV